MQENGLVTVAICGLALVCLGVTLVGGLLVLRLAGQTILPNLAGFEEPVTGRRSLLFRRHRRADLQAQADALDFDAALAQAASLTDQALPPAPLPPVDLPPRRSDDVIPPWSDEPPGLFPEEADREDL